MKSRLFLVILVGLLISSLVLVGCKPETTPTPKTTPSGPTATPAGPANWWDDLGEPEYGGALTRRTDVGGAIFPFYNPQGLVWERLFMPDWTFDRKTWPFMTMWFPPEYVSGWLAESWEQPDPLTINVKIREDVYWQNVPPVNGRQLTADDVVYNYNWAMGKSGGPPHPFFAGMLATVDEVTATDKYTVQFKFNGSGALALDTLAGCNLGLSAPEWLEQGDAQWQSANSDSSIGTGAWLLTENQPGVLKVYSRNPDYWGYDERYPKNKLPYCDEYREVGIGDMATAIAAMRSGQIDMLVDRGGPTWSQANSVAKTNPDIQLAWWPLEGNSVVLRCDTEPFTDIRVRKALQLAIDLDTIAKTHYGGTVDGTPEGLHYKGFQGYCFPYEEWPQELKEEYSFNPETARQLLAEAGYPNGFDTNIVATNAFDMELLEIIKSYFTDIGVEMEIQTFDMQTWMSVTAAGKFDQMVYSQESGMTNGLVMNLRKRSVTFSDNYTHNNDPTYEGMYSELLAASSLDEAKKLSIEMDRYALEQHWAVNTFSMGNPVLWQPWVKGYSGEFIGFAYHLYYARMWIDQGMKPK